MKTLCEALGLGLALDLLRAGHDEHPHAAARRLRPRSTVAAARRSDSRELVQLPMNTTCDRLAAQALARLRGPCSASAFANTASPGRSGTLPPIGDDHAGVGAVGDHRLDRAASIAHAAVERGAGVASAACASPRPRAPRRRPPARAGVRAGTRTSSRPARSCRRARPPRSTCCRPSCARPSTARRSPAPRYSITWPVPPSTPMRPMIASTRSLAVTPGAEAAVDVDRRASAACAAAGTASRARARPRSCRCRRRARRRRRACWCGCRRRRSSCPAACAPSSGPITCTMPRRVVPQARAARCRTPRSCARAGAPAAPRIRPRSARRRTTCAGSVGVE